MTRDTVRGRLQICKIEILAFDRDLFARRPSSATFQYNCQMDDVCFHDTEQILTGTGWHIISCGTIATQFRHW